MPVLTHRTSDLSLPQNNWHCPFELPPILSLSYEDHSSWILNDSIRTSSLNFETIQLLLSASIPDPTRNGPSIPTGCSDIRDTSMSRTRESSASRSSVFARSSTCRPLRPVQDPLQRPVTILLAWTPGLCQGLLQVMHNLFLRQTHAPQTLRTS